MIAIATGIDALDQKTKQEFEASGIKDVMIVNYREFLLKNEFNTVIISKKLIGNIEIEYLILQLKEKDVRVMYLTSRDSDVEVKLCFKYGINDIVVDPIDAKLLLNIYNKPKKFSDIKRLFLQVNSRNTVDKTIDIDRLIQMKEDQRTPEKKENQKKKEVVKERIVEKTVYVERPKEENYDSGFRSMAEKELNKIGQENKGETVNSTDRRKEQESVRPVGKIEEYQEYEEDDQEDDHEDEVKPLREEDFPKYKKKEVIRETIQETVYKLPNDYKKVIAIISPEPTGKTTLAVNMAWYFSKENIKTILVDTDAKKKDVYFHFEKNFNGCLSKISDAEDVMELGVNVNNNLKIFTDNKDSIVEFGQYDIMKLIVSAKNNSQVVIVDVSYDLEEDTIKNILEIADNTIIIVDQKVTTLNRVPEELARFRSQLHNVSIVVNRYYPLRHLEKEQVENGFFKSIDLPNGKEYDYTINKVFTMSDDAKSVLQGLANRVPAVDLKNNFIEDDIKKICSSIYIASKRTEGKKGFLFFK